MLLYTLRASLLRNLLKGKGEIATIQGREADIPGWVTITVGEDTSRASQEFQWLIIF